MIATCSSKATFLALIWWATIFCGDYVNAESGTNTCFPDRATLDAAIATIPEDNAGNGHTYEDPIDKNKHYGAIESWCFDTGLTDFSNLFRLKVSFNADISGWNVGSVTNMHAMVRLHFVRTY